jgi:hypothetical protein
MSCPRLVVALSQGIALEELTRWSLWMDGWMDVHLMLLLLLLAKNKLEFYPALPKPPPVRQQLNILAPRNLFPLIPL